MNTLWEKVLEWAAKRYGTDHSEYLVCPQCAKIYPMFGNPDEWPYSCGECDRELEIHLPDEEAIIIRWRFWKSKQKWWPQKYHVWGKGECYHYWAFWNKKWFKRSYPGPDWM